MPNQSNGEYQAQARVVKEPHEVRMEEFQYKARTEPRQFKQKKRQEPATKQYHK